MNTEDELIGYGKLEKDNTNNFKSSIMSSDMNSSENGGQSDPSSDPIL